LHLGISFDALDTGLLFLTKKLQLWYRTDVWADKMLPAIMRMAVAIEVVVPRADGIIRRDGTATKTMTAVIVPVQWRTMKTAI